MEASLRAALAAGLTVETFFAATPYLTRLQVEGVAKAERDVALFTAWHVEGFARTERLPPLRELLSDTPTPDRNASPDEMRDWLASFTDTNMQ